MIQVIKDLPEDICGLRAMGKVTRQDYDEQVEPVLKQARSGDKRLRLLAHFPPEFEGMSLGAAAQDLRLGLQYLTSIERCAVITDTSWIRAASSTFAYFAPCPVRVFANNEMTQATEWLGEAPEIGALTHRFLPERDVLTVTVDGPVRREDFDALALVIDPWIKEHGPLRGLVIHTKRFPGWQDFGSMVRHFAFVGDRHRQIGRVAVAADGVFAQVMPQIAKHFVEAEVRRFGYDDFTEAIHWASAGSVVANPRTAQETSSRPAHLH